MTKHYAYYNEFDPFAVEWLRRLIKQGSIMQGEVDARSIHDVRPGDLKGFTRHHFFAGIGGWDRALQLARWPLERPVWTGSCPCQPFSSAGGRKGITDDRHLWPIWFRLIQQFHPASLYGEQVASAIAYGWLDDVYKGMEPENYALGSAVLPAYSVGAPHKRDRLWFVAHSAQRRWREGYTHGRRGVSGSAPPQEWRGFANSGSEPCTGIMADTNDQYGRGQHGFTSGAGTGSRTELGRDGDVGQPSGARPQGFSGYGDNGGESRRVGAVEDRPASPSGFWRDGVWCSCADGKTRPIKPGLPLLAHGVSGRMAVCLPAEQAIAANEIIHWYNRTGALKGFGNAIVPQVAAEFIGATA